MSLNRKRPSIQRIKKEDGDKGLTSIGPETSFQDIAGITADRINIRNFHDVSIAQLREIPPCVTTVIVDQLIYKIKMHKLRYISAAYRIGIRTGTTGFAMALLPEQYTEVIVTASEYANRDFLHTPKSVEVIEIEGKVTEDLLKVFRNNKATIKTTDPQTKEIQDLIAARNNVANAKKTASSKPQPKEVLSSAPTKRPASSLGDSSELMPPPPKRARKEDAKPAPTIAPKANSVSNPLELLAYVALAPNVDTLFNKRVAAQHKVNSQNEKFDEKDDPMDFKLT